MKKVTSKLFSNMKNDKVSSESMVKVLGGAIYTPWTPWTATSVRGADTGRTNQSEIQTD